MVEARLGAERRWWGRIKPYLPWVLAVMVIAGAILALIYVPKMEVPVCPPGKEGLPPKICFDIENEARKTLAYIMGGVLAIIGITLAYRRIRALERQVLVGQEQLKVVQEGQITERFTRAIEQLGSDKMEIRLGGIYALERIANDSDKDYSIIIETLTAYVRERAKWRESAELGKDQLLDEKYFTKNEEREANIRSFPAVDIQAVLNVLARRKYRFKEGEDNPLDLSATNLRGAMLNWAHLEGAIFVGSQLQKAHLWEAHLEKASLTFANLSEAFIIRANFEGADLGVSFLIKARLEGANFARANLENAFLLGTRLNGAKFKETNLKGVDLRFATGLTKEQLSEAILDKETKLPDYLKEQVQGFKEPEDSLN